MRPAAAAALGFLVSDRCTFCDAHASSPLGSRPHVRRQRPRCMHGALARSQWKTRYHVSSSITGATLSVQDYPNVLNPDKWLNATFPLLPFFAEDENRVHKKHFL